WPSAQAATGSTGLHSPPAGNMEAVARRQEELQQEGAAAGGSRSLSGQSYWLDLWLFVLFDLALLVFTYLLP
uniref:Uncharacterized protein n=1 Tax=Dromaius novaehollandiae TaxID=8790 RepID=A0A8C4JMR0_DRONO